MSSITKSYKAFSEEIHDMEIEHNPVFPRGYSPTLRTYSDTRSESRWSVAISNFSHFGRGLGAGRSISTTSDDLLEKDLEAMAGDGEFQPHGHALQMERYLLRLGQVLPHEASVAIVIPAGDVMALEQTATRWLPTAQKLFLISGILITVAWVFCIIRFLGLDYPDFFTHGLVLLVASTLVIVLAL